MPTRPLKGTPRVRRSPGKLAGITVLSRDIMVIPDQDILSADVVFTIVGGKVMYDRTAGVKR
jgi:hypothetical protein